MGDRFRGEAAPEMGPEGGQEFIRAQESWGTLEGTSRIRGRGCCVGGLLGAVNGEVGTVRGRSW